jgi:cell division protein FtsQ
MIAKKKIYHVLGLVAWGLLLAGVVTLLVSAVKTENYILCKKVEIKLIDNKAYKMLDEGEIFSSLWPEEKNGFKYGKRPSLFDLSKLEKQLEKNPWVLSSDFYFDQNRTLHIDVQQRTPIARGFTPEGNSFFLDKSYSILPVKSNDIISLPVYTNFYINPASAKAKDSSILKRIVSLSEFILADSFWMAQVETVNISPDGTFELTNQVGDQNILLGERDDWKNVFAKLKVLYQYLNKENAWSKYNKIDLQFIDQAVCVRKNSSYKVLDSTLVKNAPSPETSDSIQHNPVVNRTNEKVGKLGTKSTLPIQKNKSNTPNIPKKQ